MSGVVLSIMAHPDDAEILCGGTLLLLAKRGWTVHIATATEGDCGSPDRSPEEIAAVRRKEAKRSAALLRGTWHWLGLRDLEVIYDRAAIRSATRLLRRVRPDVVITHSPSDYMIDHEETAKIARAACFNAPIPNAPVGSAASERPIETIPALYYADPVEGLDPFGIPLLPSIAIDTSEVIDEKAELLACHASQREWLRAHHGIDEYLERMKDWGRERGRTFGLAYAEGFRQHLGHAYPREDVLARALGPLHHSNRREAP